MASLIFAAVELWPAFFAALFIEPDSPTMAVCVHAMRIGFVMLPLISVNVIGSAYFQSTAQAAKSLVSSLSRSGFFLIPCVLILPPLLGLDGVWVSQPIADFGSVALTAVLLLHSLSGGRSAEPRPIPVAAPVPVPASRSGASGP
jgi:Na+-driven multidrug efflux pump